MFRESTLGVQKCTGEPLSVFSHPYCCANIPRFETDRPCGRRANQWATPRHKKNLVFWRFSCSMFIYTVYHPSIKQYRCNFFPCLFTVQAMLSILFPQCLLVSYTFDASFQAILPICMRQMLAVSYTFNASLQAMLPARLIQFLLFSLHFMPACRQCCLHTFYNACSFLYILCQFASEQRSLYGRILRAKGQDSNLEPRTYL